MLQQLSYGKTTLPLLMGFTPKTPIQNGAVNEYCAYNDTLQITKYNCALVGTKCLKTAMTKIPRGVRAGDSKNEIDDSRNK